MRHVLQALFVIALTVCTTANAADTPKGAKMAGANADKETPKRVVLDGVPKVRYLKDGLCPFALCLKSCMDFLGEPYSYDYILGTSGACFRMAWNHTKWDEGNMDVGRLGPEPFRRGLRAVGLKHRFLVKKSWWPDATGDDVEMLDDTTAKTVLRTRIVESIRRGLPVLAFGVVGPPEVSIICGYDDGGAVLVGWAAMDGEHPKDQREPNGMFRQKDWFARTEGLILIEGKPAKPDLDRVYRESLVWAYEVMTLPKGTTHLFGQQAYKGWASAMIKDSDFPADDEKTLQKRRHTVWDGLIMLAERGVAAKFLRGIVRRQPEAVDHVPGAVMSLMEDGDGARRICQALGNHMLPAEQLSDPCCRRLAADAILAAGEKNARAARYLASALGKPPGGFSFDGKEFKGLRPAYRNMTLMGCIAGCMRYLREDTDDVWLYGVTGVAFMLNIDEKVDVSGPTSWDCTHLYKMAPHLGISLKNRVRALVSDADFEAKQQAAAKFVRAKIDADFPCYGWDGCMEWLTINGYSDAACLQWSHYFRDGYRAQPWPKLGRQIPNIFQVISVELTRPPTDERATVRAALEFALKQRPTGKPLDLKNAQGIQGYDLWIRCLETGDWLQAEGVGVHHNVACWHECRAYAERFLRLCGEKLGGDLKPLFDEAADHYRNVRKALCEMQTIFIYKYPLPPCDDAGIKRAVVLLRTAKDAETKGLAVIERIVRKMDATPDKGTTGS